MRDDFRFSPLQNGLEFLLSSLERLAAASSIPVSSEAPASARWEQKRHLKYALLNVCSSVEVIFKVRLQQEHWSLVYANVNKADNSAQDEGEFESVAFGDLMSRLVQICKVNLSEDDRKQLLGIRKRRNRLEHYGTVDSLLAVMASVSSTVGFIIDFAQSSFSRKALEEERPLINAIRAELGACRAFIEHRWEEINAGVEVLALVVECPACQQLALGIEPGFINCRFCHYQASPHETANEYIARSRSRGSHHVVGAIADRDDLDACPHCHERTLVVGLTRTKIFCFSCGGQWQPEDLAHCRECAELFLAASGGTRCRNCC